NCATIFSIFFVSNSLSAMIYRHPTQQLTGDRRGRNAAGGRPTEREVRHHDGVARHAHTYEDGCFANRSTHSSEQNQYVFLLKWRSPAARFVSTCILHTGSIAYS